MIKLIKVISSIASRSLFENVFPYLCEKAFHSTSCEGYEGIIKSGYICCGNGKVKSVWSGGYFKIKNCVSFSDYYHCKSKLKCLKALQKYKFYDQGGGSVSYHFVLKQEFYHHLITFSDIKDEWEKSGHQQLVPYVESGIKENVPLSWFDTVVELNIVNV